MRYLPRVCVGDDQDQGHIVAVSMAFEAMVMGMIRMMFYDIDVVGSENSVGVQSDQDRSADVKVTWTWLSTRRGWRCQG